MLTLHIPPTTPVKAPFRGLVQLEPRLELRFVDERVLTWVKV
jgi:hypothetical protein